MEPKKMGRPTDNRKETQIAVRFDSDTLQILDNYCERKQVSRAEGVRQAVRKLKKLNSRSAVNKQATVSKHKPQKDL